MKNLMFGIIFCASIFGSSVSYSQVSDAEAQRIIKRSIENYSGSCPCPYSFDRAGHLCGGRSAYSRPGGASPICYKSDIK